MENNFEQLRPILDRAEKELNEKLMRDGYVTANDVTKSLPELFVPFYYIPINDMIGLMEMEKDKIEQQRKDLEDQYKIVDKALSEYRAKVLAE